METLKLLTSFAALLVCTQLCADALTSTTQPSKIFAKTVKEDVQLSVVSEPVATELIKVVAPKASEQGAKFSRLHVFLVGKTSQIELGSTVITEFDDFRQSFKVLDVFVGQDEIIVGCLQGDLVALWRLPLDSWVQNEGGWVWIRPHMLASAKPLPADATSISMSVSADGLWLLKTQLNRESVHPIIMHFQQSDPHEWKFIPREVKAP